MTDTTTPPARATAREPAAPRPLPLGSLRVSLPPRALAGFIAAILAVLAIWILSQRLSASRAESAERMTDALELAEDLEALLSTLKDAETGQRGFLLTGSEHYLDPYEAAVLELPHELDRIRRAFAGSPAQLERIETVGLLSTQHMTQLAETIALQRAGREADALAMVQSGRGKVTMDRLRELVAEIKTMEREQLDARSQEWHDARFSSSLVISGGSLLLLVLIAASAYLSAKGFREQQVQAWIRTGQTELGHHMQGEQDVQRLADAIVGFLARYLGAQVGVVHKQGLSGQLRRVGAYGLSDADRDPHAPPPGLTRQALEHQTLLHVADVPDDYLEVTSGLGRRRPLHLVLAPTTVDGHANAVIELGFFRPAEPHELELLRRISESVGMALRSAHLVLSLRP